MKENHPFQQGFRGCLISLLTIVLAVGAMAVSTNFHYPQQISCGGMLGAGFPLLFICDDWGGGSPTGSWGRIDFVDVVNGGIRPGGFLIDFLFYILLILIFWSVVSSFLKKGANQRDLGWTLLIMMGFVAGSSFAFLTVWSSDSYIKNPPLGTPTPVIPTATILSVTAQAIDLENMDPTTAIAYLAEDINVGDGGLFSGQSCSSPCAFGIRIGETQLDQVIPVLEKNGISRCWTEPNISWSLISCGGNRFNVQVDMQTSLVNAIWFDPSVPISLGEIIEKYGEPNYVTVDQEAPGTIYPRFYWNSIRMLVVLPEMPGEAYDVEKTTEVEGISFSDENLYRTSEKQTDPYYKTWNGFGLYQPPVGPTPSVAMPTVSMTP